MTKDYLTINELVEYVGLSRRTIYRLIKAQQFPKNINLTARKSVWKKVEIVAWVNAKERESYAR